MTCQLPGTSTSPQLCSKHLGKVGRIKPKIEMPFLAVPGQPWEVQMIISHVYSLDLELGVDPTFYTFHRADGI